MTTGPIGIGTARCDQFPLKSDVPRQVWIDPLDHSFHGTREVYVEDHRPNPRSARFVSGAHHEDVLTEAYNQAARDMGAIKAALYKALHVRECQGSAVAVELIEQLSAQAKAPEQVTLWRLQSGRWATWNAQDPENMPREHADYVSKEAIDTANATIAYLSGLLPEPDGLGDVTVVRVHQRRMASFQQPRDAEAWASGMPHIAKVESPVPLTPPGGTVYECQENGCVPQSPEGTAQDLRELRQTNRELHGELKSALREVREIRSSDEGARASFWRNEYKSQLDRTSEISRNMARLGNMIPGPYKPNDKEVFLVKHGDQLLAVFSAKEWADTWCPKTGRVEAVKVDP